MRVRFNVGSRGKSSRAVEAENWLVALGHALEAEGGIAAIERLGCEVLKNGSVIVRDAATGAGWVVQPEHVSDVGEGGGEELEIVDESEPAPASRYQAIDDAEDVIGACAAALDLGRAAVGADGGVVWLVVDDGLWGAAAAGTRGPKLAGLVLPTGVGIAADVVRTGHIVVLADATGDPRHFAEADRLVGVASRDVLCVPMWRGNAVVGAIELCDLGEGARFSRAGMHELRTLAAALAARVGSAA